MTNTKFRKKALLSSVAMLLVALVALGSATFAWFVANPNTTSQGLVMKTSASAGLVVASSSMKDLTNFSSNPLAAFGQSTYFDAKYFEEDTTNSIPAHFGTDTSVEHSLQPVSPNTTSGGVAATGAPTLAFGSVAAAKSNAVAASTDNVAPANGGDVFFEDVYLKTSTNNDGDVAIVQSVNVRINLVADAVTASTVKNGVKVALVAHQKAITYTAPGASESTTVPESNTLLGIWRPSTGADTKTWNGTAAAATTSIQTDYTYSTGNKPLSTGLVADTAPNGTYIRVYVYLDGENAGVFSENVPVVSQLISSIDVAFSTSSTATLPSA